MYAWLCVLANNSEDVLLLVQIEKHGLSYNPLKFAHTNSHTRTDTHTQCPVNQCPWGAPAAVNSLSDLIGLFGGVFIE